MQNKYIGDIGDFGKFYLLKKLITNDMQLGINWYLVSVQEKNNDGKHKLCKYPDMKKEDWDIDLYNKIVAAKNLEGLQGIIPNTKCFDVLTPQSKERQHWLEESLKKMNDCKVIFCDPDNGFLPKYPAKLHKYTFYGDIKFYYDNEKSVIVYQHQNRKTFENHSKEILAELEKVGISRRIVKIFYLGKNGFGRGGGRYYYLIVRPEHKEKFEKQIKKIDKIIEVKTVYET